MSALLSSLPPPPSRPGPGLRVCAATPWGESRCNERARLAELERLSPEELKLIAMARYALLRSYRRIPMREIARRSGLETDHTNENGEPAPYGKTTVQYWLDARAEERCPPADFVLWLESEIEKHARSVGTARCA